MARLTIHTAQSAPEAVRPALSAAEQGAGYLSNLLGVLATRRRPWRPTRRCRRSTPAPG